MNSKKLLPTFQKTTPAPVVMIPLIIGYARVSTAEQSLDMQLTALRNAGCTEIFQEKVSATNAHRPQFALLLKFLQRGDTLVVYAFNRLSRDLAQLLTLIDRFKAAGITLRSTSEPGIDPYTTNGRMIVSMTGAVDENERRRVRDRTVDGMAEKKRQGMSLGRPRKATPELIARMKMLRRQIGATATAAKLKVSVPTVYAYTS